jgi:hypothetical protein
MTPDQLIAKIGSWARLVFLAGLAIVAAGAITIAASAMGGYTPIPAPVHNGWRGVWGGAELAGFGGLVGLLFGSLKPPAFRRRSG